MEKSVKVTPPEGYEIDKVNSTFEEIKFKKIESKLPTKWEDFREIVGFYIDASSTVSKLDRCASDDNTKDVWPTRELAEASLALCQLIRYRDAWNDGWVADWKYGSSRKYCIVCMGGVLYKDSFGTISKSLVFKTSEIRDKFLETFKDLLEVAKPLL
jgi:hypothetical protein